MIDTHAHIYDEKYGNGGAQRIIESMQADGLEAIVCVGCDMESSLTCDELAAANDGIYAAVGVHPYYPETVTKSVLDGLAELCTHPKTVAVGEIGLDYHRDDFDRKAQVAAMNMQYELARHAGLPIVFHLREGTGDFTDFLRGARFENSGVMHCFSGSVETAKICLDKGLYLAFGGKLTYHNAKNLAQVAAYAPLDRLLLETDAPYLTPARYLGQDNFPKYVSLVCDRLAEIRGIPREEAERATTENAKKLFFKMSYGK